MQLTGYKDKKNREIRVGNTVKTPDEQYLVIFDPFLGYTLFCPLKWWFEKLNKHNAKDVEII